MSADCGDHGGCDDCHGGCGGCGEKTHIHGPEAAQVLDAALPALQDDFLARSLSAYALLAQGRADEARAAYAALRADAPAAPLQDAVGALLCEALCLDALGRHDEAMALREAALRRLAAEDPGSALRSLGEVALYDVALRLLRRGKERLLVGDEAAGRAEIDELRRRLAAHPAHAGSALASLLAGYGALLLGEREAAAPLLAAALAKDGRAVREAGRTLRGLGPLPADDALAELLAHR